MNSLVFTLYALNEKLLFPFFYVIKIEQMLFFTKKKKERANAFPCVNAPWVADGDDSKGPAFMLNM